AVAITTQTNAIDPDTSTRSLALSRKASASWLASTGTPPTTIVVPGGRDGTEATTPPASNQPSHSSTRLTTATSAVVSSVIRARSPGPCRLGAICPARDRDAVTGA